MIALKLKSRLEKLSCLDLSVLAGEAGFVHGLRGSDAWEAQGKFQEFKKFSQQCDQ